MPLLARRERCVFAPLSARVGSIGDNRQGGWYPYRTSKSALIQILRTLAIKVASSRPQAIIVDVHPGMVTSGLSRPFWPDPTASGVISPEENAAYLLRVLDGLCSDDTGGVFAQDGSPIPA